MKSGTGIFLLAMSRISVDFPCPLGPTSPYLLFSAMVRDVPSKSALPLTRTVRLSTLMSRAWLTASLLMDSPSPW